MKTKRSFWRIRSCKQFQLLSLLLLGLLLLGGCGMVSSSSSSGTMDAVEASKEPEAAPEVFQGEGLTLSVDYGYGKYVKVGRYMRVLADISNSGQNFSGTLSVIIPSEYEKRYMYQKEVSLAAGETKRLEMAVPVGGEASRYNFILADGNGKAVAQKSVKAYVVSRDTDYFAGILTDDTQGLAYLSSNQMKTFYLDADSFPEDVLGLDSLDIIIINDFNTDTLNEKQYGALQEFVLQGGTLVLGTGSTGVKTMAAFDDSFLTGEMGELTRKATAFGLDEERLLEIKNQLLEEALEKQEQKEKEKELLEEAKGEGAEQAESSAVDGAEEVTSSLAEDILPETEAINALSLSVVEKDILSIHLEGAFTLVKEDDVVLLEGLYKGQGRVLLSTMDLGLDSSLRDTIGREISNQIVNNVSASRVAKVRQENNRSDYIYLLRQGADLVDVEKVPTVGKYALILLLYLAVIGPPLYFLLKKLDKRNLTWLLIPIFSVLFGFFIYGIGGSTRQDSPYIQYMEIKTIENGVENTDTFFGVTSPYNNDYALSFAGTQQLVPNWGGFYYNGGNDSSKDDEYNIGIKDRGDVTEVEIRDYSAFETVYFRTMGAEAAEGGIESNLDFAELTMKGEVTNRLGYGLKQASLYAYGLVYPLGDIEDGQTVSVSGEDGHLLLSRSDVYSYDDFLTTLSGTNPYVNQRDLQPEKVRWYYAYEYYLSTLAASPIQGCYLLGFTEDAGNAFLEGTGLETRGSNMVVAAADVRLAKDGMACLPRLDAYVQNMEGAYDAEEHYLYSESVQMELQFGSNEAVQLLVYSESLNREFVKNNNNSYVGSGFDGEIKAYNVATGNYDLLFSGGTADAVPISDYLDADNKVRLLIEPDAARMSSSGVVSLPVLSAIKEEK